MPTQAKFIGTMFYEPQVMLGLCKDDIARGNAGFCTGDIIATLHQMGEVCVPQEIEYEQIVQAVVDRIQAFPQVRYTRTVVEAALRAWPCKK
jgi:hypothetical protein